MPTRQTHYESPCTIEEFVFHTVWQTRGVGKGPGVWLRVFACFDPHVMLRQDL